VSQTSILKEITFFWNQQIKVEKSLFKVVLEYDAAISTDLTTALRF